jgi:transcription-repair coupling factor (superfamily II helicase)
VLACEASAKLVTLHLREDTPLDPAKLLQLVQGKHSPWKLSPDYRISRRTPEAEKAPSGLEAAEAVLAALSRCRRADA